MSDYEQPIFCEKCKRLLGFTAYFREEYTCTECTPKLKKKIKELKREGWKMNE